MKVLHVLGIDSENISDKKKSDIVVRTENNKIILIEVKGVKGGLTRDHLRQLQDWLTEYWQEHGIEPKGLILLNPHRFDPPDERENYYPSDCIEFAETRNICLMTTMDLFNILIKSINEKIDKGEILNHIINTVGIWDGKKVLQ